MPHPAIRVSGLSKQYRIGESLAGYQTLREAIVDVVGRCARRRRMAARRPGRSRAIWALQDVSFQIEQGQAVGIIGKNGAGKSTLLKLLSRVTDATRGRIELWGRVGSMLEVGTGFHPELTGRENIYLNGVLLGMTRREIGKKSDEIISFAEVEQFVDTPVKRYSSGMYLRLAFAVAAHLEPEILLVDEVLAVGDAAFRKKCLGKMSEVGTQGRTVLFVSHDMAAIQALCPQTLLLENGAVKAFEGTQSVMQTYLRQQEAARNTFDLRQHPERRPGSRPILQEISLLNGAGEPTEMVETGGTLRLDIRLDASSGLRMPHLKCGFNSATHVRVFTVASSLSKQELPELVGETTISCTIPSVPLVPGQYAIEVAVGPLHQTLDSVGNAAVFEVIASDYFGSGKLPGSGQGLVLVPSQWEVRAGER